jgi:hypothetical protein
MACPARDPRAVALLSDLDAGTTSAMQSEVYGAFRQRGAAEDKALEAAAVLGKRDEDPTEAVTDITLPIAGVKGEQIVHRWMLGCILATRVAVAFKLFSH